MDRKLNLYIVRHGETILNRYRKLQGWSDSPLTEEGKVIAMEAGKKLAHVPFHRVYTSDLSRTIETANIMLEAESILAEIWIYIKEKRSEKFSLAALKEMGSPILGVRLLKKMDMN